MNATRNCVPDAERRQRIEARGRVETVSARPVVGSNAWRAMFDLVPDDDSTEPVNLRLYLALDGQALTETWLYQYEPPPVSQRGMWITS